MATRKAKAPKAPNAFRARKPAELKLRLTEPLRKQIEAAAAARGASMNLEMVERLERTFDADSAMTDTLVYAHGREMTGIALLMLQTMDWVGRLAGFRKNQTAQGSFNWMSDPWAFEQAMKAAFRILSLAKPTGVAVAPSEMDGGNRSLEDEHLAVFLSHGFLAALSDPAHPMAERVGAVAELLGPVAAKLSAASAEQFARFSSKPE